MKKDSSQKDRNPTLKQKVEQYEAFLHKINAYIVSCNDDGIRELVKNADEWSYSHRKGEFVNDSQRQKMINNAFWKLLDTPNSDKATKERQEAWKKFSKEKSKAFMENL